jgi:hypothetical protein
LFPRSDRDFRPSGGASALVITLSGNRSDGGIGKPLDYVERKFGEKHP